MKELVEKFIRDNQGSSFVFESGFIDPIFHLRHVTKSVPNLPGVYLVFAEKSDTKTEHLRYEIDGLDYELVYFGKAGGFTSNGRRLSQGLNGRINNVVSNDESRALYWHRSMSEFGCSKFLVIYTLLDHPQELENELYNLLDNGGLQYPILNKRRGRRRK
jgi:hypothetical protein